MSSFLWHDYETFGTNARTDVPVQFSCLRTDMSLEPVGEMQVLFCRPPLDYLPDPDACAVHGISPQEAWSEGLSEANFAAAAYRQMCAPGTCNVGYNSIGFDDEFSRHLFFRNLRDPYAFHRGSCSRWDLLSLVRACGALRPAGLIWPVREDSRPDYRLEAVATDNGIVYRSHDASEDVQATLALARLIRRVQPRLFDYALGLRDRSRPRELLNGSVPLVAVTTRLPWQQRYCAAVLPLGERPGRPGSWVVADLTADCTALLDQPDRHWWRSGAPVDSRRVLIELADNRCPFVAPLAVLDEDRAGALGIDLAACIARADLLSGRLSWLRALITDAWADWEYPSIPTDTDAEGRLYEGFPNRDDQRELRRLLEVSPQQLSPDLLQDQRLREIVPRFRAHNWPEQLDPEERSEWRNQCRERLHHPPAGRRSVAGYLDLVQRVEADLPEMLAEALRSYPGWLLQRIAEH